MKKETQGKSEAKEKLKKHLNNMPLKNRPYVVETKPVQVEPKQK